MMLSYPKKVRGSSVHVESASSVHVEPSNLLTLTSTKVFPSLEGPRQKTEQRMGRPLAKDREAPNKRSEGAGQRLGSRTAKNRRAKTGKGPGKRLGGAAKQRLGRPWRDRGYAEHRPGRFPARDREGAKERPGKAPSKGEGPRQKTEKAPSKDREGRESPRRPGRRRARDREGLQQKTGKAPSKDQP